MPLTFLKKENKKNTFGIIIGILIIIAIVFLLLSPSEKKKNNEQISNAFEKKEQAIKKEAVINKTIIPTLLNNSSIENNLTNENNNNENFDIKALEKIQNDEFQINNSSKEDSVKNEIESKVIDLTQQTNNQIQQKEMIKKLEKTQKPKDMVAFLKEIQSKIFLQNLSKSFKYDLKEYKVGDMFLNFYKIEDITDMFIRFSDGDYSYNLRFIK